MLLDEARCRRIIAQAFPDLAVGTLQYFSAGWDYELWRVNGELLFRFPLRPECAEPLRVEARLLGDLAGRLSVPVPRPEYVSSGCDEFPMPFFAYRRLPGMPLEQAHLGEEGLARVGAQLGRFLTELHSFPVDRASALGVPCFTADGWRDKERAFRMRCDREVSPLLSDIEREAVAQFWDGYLEDDAMFAFTPALIHNDLGSEHLLIDRQSGRLTGVIDFGDARGGDPALDFAAVPPALREAAMASYIGPKDDRLLVRTEVYRQIDPFHHVLYGLHVEETGHVETGLRGIREQIVWGKKHK